MRFPTLMTMTSVGRAIGRRCAAGVLLAAISGAVAGCQLFGAMVEKTNGDDPIKAIYVPAQVPTVVVVENYNGSSSLDAENLTRFIEAELTENKVVPVVSSDKVEVLRDADPAAFHGMTVQAIGKAVGATQILYVDKVEANVDRPEASDMVQGGLTANARIVSTDTGNSVWPAGTGAGMPFSVEVPFTPLSKTNPSDMRSALARSMAVQIVDTFHDHQPAASDVDNPQRP